MVLDARQDAVSSPYRPHSDDLEDAMSAEPMPLFTPMIYLKGAVEAIPFYQDVFGVQEIAERRMYASQFVPGAENDPALRKTVVYSKLVFKDGSALNVADLWGDPSSSAGAIVGNNIHIGIQHTDLGVQKAAFDKLAADGTVLEALEPKPWGAVYGIVQDKYGVIWEMNAYTT